MASETMTERLRRLWDEAMEKPSLIQGYTFYRTMDENDKPLILAALNTLPLLLDVAEAAQSLLEASDDGLWGMWTDEEKEAAARIEVALQRLQEAGK